MPKTLNFYVVCVLILLSCSAANATVSITSFTSSFQSPEPIGKTITWTAKATDTGTGPLTFQFNTSSPQRDPVRDGVGGLSAPASCCLARGRKTRSSATGTALSRVYSS